MYQIITDATADYSVEMLDGLPALEVIPMDVNVGDDSYKYGPGGNLKIEDFYAMLRSGKFASTSAINPYTYTEEFEKYLSKGIDVVYLCFTPGLSGCYRNALLAKNELADKYPERRLVVIDSAAASIGLGLLVEQALEKQKEGYSLQELTDWVEARKLNVAHWFTVDEFEHLKRGGRVSAAVAVVGTALQIKPLLTVNREGKLEVKEKARGRKHAMEAQMRHMRQSYAKELGNYVLIGHGDDLERAQQLGELVKSEFPETDIHYSYIGPVIGSHTGPGMIAFTFWGNDR